MSKIKIRSFFVLCIMMCVCLQPTYALNENNIINQETNFQISAENFINESELSTDAKSVIFEELSAEALSFLSDNGVKFDSSNLKVLNALEKLCDEVPGLYGLNEDILSLKEDTETYGFSEEQIQKYIEGLVTTTPIIAFSRENAAERNVISGPISSGRPLDKVGGGYEVKSKAGYFKSTSYLTLPSFTSFYNYSVREQRTAGYMMFTLSSVNKTPIDIGISYSKGNSNSDTPRFYLFYYDPSNTSTNPNDAGGVAKFKEYPISTPISQ